MTGPLSQRFLLAGLAFATVNLTSCGSLGLNARKSSELPQTNSSLDGARGVGMAIFRSTAVASLRQPVTTTKLGFALFYQRMRAMLRVNDSPPVLETQPSEIPGSPEFEHLLDHHGIRHAGSGTLAFLVNGSSFYPDFEKEVAHARKSIDVQVYIFDNDDAAVHCADLLKARSGEIPVHVLCDDMGTTIAQTAAPDTPAPAGFTPPAEIVDYLREGSRVKVRRALNPWLVSDHTKLFVFDHERAYLGGMNIGREYRSEWHDLMARVEGPIVSPLQREFTRAWRKAGPWGDLALIRNPIHRDPPPLRSGIPLRILRTDTVVGRYDVLKATRYAIRASRKRIWVENPYFAADDIEDELVAAARRGVDVRVILPKRGDSTIMDTANLAAARHLMAAGVKVIRYPGMTHMKVMMCDGWATFGSANLDTLSMRINRELNLAFTDPKTIKALENAVFVPDFKRSTPLRKEETDGVIVPLVQSVARQL